jgi:DNA processing protein
MNPDPDRLRLDPEHPDYPRSLYRLDEPPAVSVSGRLPRGRRIAIVGSREPQKGSAGFAFVLAYHLARAGVIVVSGGAVGIDRAAHEGALHAEGATWLVSPTGRGWVYPASNRPFVARLEASSTSRVLWPFPDGTEMSTFTPRLRNGVLVGLAEAVIVVQASLKSGSRNAARWARHLGVKVFVPPGTPWDPEFYGSLREIRNGATMVPSMAELLSTLGVPYDAKADEQLLGHYRDYSPHWRKEGQERVERQTYSDPPLFPITFEDWTEEEKLVFSKVSMAPTQRDKIIDAAGLGASATITALLTLSLKDVVVEGPDGFFRSRIAL